MRSWPKYFRNWYAGLGKARPVLRIGISEIHSSLIFSLGLVAGGCLALSYLIPSYEEFRTIAVTLPAVWLVSLIVRLAAQELAIGDYAHDSDTVICPTGNLLTDYEYLPPRTILAYAVSGQLVSVALMSIGLVVNAATSDSVGDTVAVAELLDFRGGWSSQAWATQIFWVNVFLFGIHLLPTVPFDTRAFVFGLCSFRREYILEPSVYRRLGVVNTHLAALIAGGGVTAGTFGLIWGFDLMAPVAVLVGAAFLFLAGRSEVWHAEELERQYVPNPTTLQLSRQAASETPTQEPPFDMDEDAIDFLANEATQPESPMSVEDEPDLPADLPEPHGLAPGGETLGPLSTLDVDDILRKVYRDGFESLDSLERQALLTASERIKGKRG